MFIIIRTIDGKLEKTLEISKTISISDLKVRIAAVFSVKLSHIHLFYRGKQLEDCYRVYDYHLNHHEVVQLLIKPKSSTVENKCLTNFTQNDKINGLALVSPKEDSTTIDKQSESTSRYYRTGDPIDCINEENGAWYEAIIQNIYNDVNKQCLIYRVQWTFLVDTEPFDVTENMIRPRARHCLSIDQIKINDKVMVNYNIDEPNKIGYCDGAELKIENCKVNSRSKIYKIEKPALHYSDFENNSNFNEVDDKPRTIVITCNVCEDDKNVKCKECGCFVCSGKEKSHEIILCDECDKAYHISCLNPPLEQVPEDDWYCPECKIHDDLVIKAGEKLRPSKRKIKPDLKKGQKDWGRGMGCMSRVKDCTIVPTNHKGPIPGTEVGMSWRYRLQVIFVFLLPRIKVSEAGVHRPHVAGIHGRENECAYSLVLSGGYEDDVDNGDEFLYTGSGGRDLSGNKRTAAQSSDQKLTKMNKALALNCNAQFNNVEGATAINWQEGIPVRVIRSAKLKKYHQAKIYAPEEGFRYDGIYKVVKYFPEKGKRGFLVWRYLLRRDDPNPSPWTSEGKKRIKNLGLRMIEYDLPSNVLTVKNMEINDQKKNLKRKRDKLGKDKNESCSKKPKVIHYELEENIVKLIDSDKLNKKVWKDCCSLLSEGKMRFINNVIDRFTCVCCQEIVWKPITTKCLHNICQNCICRSFKADVFTCPVCRHSIKKTRLEKINEQLAVTLENLFPGYGSERMTSFLAKSAINTLGHINVISSCSSGSI
ncbi:GSCOCG00008581001-RA-CDS [Cotesia congregata]|nr:GSCOCG00008581001-RA-CDS [Cotesia congregata]